MLLMKMWMIGRVFLFYGWLLIAVEAASEVTYPRVFRTFMEEAGPSAFAVELSEKVGLCYDASRGGINRIWPAGIDLSPTLQAKINQPAKVLGEAFYVEEAWQPLRLGDFTKESSYRFKGYRYEEGAVIFEYTLRGLLVRETLKLSEDGYGVVRVIKLPKGGGDGFLKVEVQPQAEVVVAGGREIEATQWQFAEGGEIVVTITPKTKQ